MDWQNIIRDRADSEAGLDPFTLAMVIESFRAKGKSFHHSHDGRWAVMAARHVEKILEKAKP